MIVPHPFSAKTVGRQVHLRVMATTDLHVHLYPYDYYSDRAVQTVGLSRTASLIEGVRAEAANTLLVDNGDFLQGNPMGDYIAYERGMKDGDLHPVIAAMNALGFDAATIGNHEFNYGLDFLMKSMAGARFPTVLANVARQAGRTARDDKTLFEPYVILDRRFSDGDGTLHPCRIGIIGFTPPQIMHWDRQHLSGRVVTRDIVETARDLVPQIREAGADLVIALSHSGIGPARHRAGMENASVPLAALDGIDALVTGHSHQVFPSQSYAGLASVDAMRGTLAGKPAVMGGFWGSHMGLIDLLLERDGSQWRVLSSTSEARPIARRTADRVIEPLVPDTPRVLDVAADAHNRTLSYIRRPVGRTRVALNSYFALVASDPPTQVVNEAQHWYLKRMLAETRHRDLPLLSAAAPFKAGGRGGPDYYTDVAKGDVAIKNVADLYIYPNAVRAVGISGAELRNWLERSAGIFNRVLPGATDAFLIDPDFPSYNFDVIDGVSYRIDLSQPARFDRDGELVRADAWRIRDLDFDGRPVEDEARFVVATNSYRASGGGDFPGAQIDSIIFEAPDSNRDVIVRYIADREVLDPRRAMNWSFVPMPGTSVLFDTGPGSADHLGGVGNLDIVAVGDTEDGFLRYRLRL